MMFVLEFTNSYVVSMVEKSDSRAESISKVSYSKSKSIDPVLKDLKIFKLLTYFYSYFGYVVISKVDFEYEY